MKASTKPYNVYIQKDLSFKDRLTMAVCLMFGGVQIHWITAYILASMGIYVTSYAYTWRNGLKWGGYLSYGTFPKNKRSCEKHKLLYFKYHHDTSVNGWHITKIEKLTCL